MKTLPTGLMIHDNSERPLQRKLINCCERFKAKFGRWPTMVWLNEVTLGDYISPNGLRLETSQYCRPDVFLVGPLSREV